MDINILTEIQARLKPNIHLSVKHQEFGPQYWKSTLATEHNHWPHWISFRDGDSPEEAVQKALDYLDGKSEDPLEGRRRSAKDFLANTK